MADHDPEPLTPNTGWKMTLAAAFSAGLTLIGAGAWLADQRRDLRELKEDKAKLEKAVDALSTRLDAQQTAINTVAGVNADQNRTLTDLTRHDTDDDKRWSDFMQGDWRDVYRDYLQSRRDAQRWASPQRPR